MTIIQISSYNLQKCLWFLGMYPPSNSSQISPVNLLRHPYHSPPKKKKNKKMLTLPESAMHEIYPNSAVADAPLFSTSQMTVKAADSEQTTSPTNQDSHLRSGEKLYQDSLHHLYFWNPSWMSRSMLRIIGVPRYGESASLCVGCFEFFIFAWVGLFIICYISSNFGQWSCILRLFWRKCLWAF